MNDNDIKLVDACLQKNEKAWTELLSIYRHDCLIISRSLNVSHCFDDVFSEFILKLLGRPGQVKGALERYNGSSSLRTYLSVVFSRVVLSHHRKTKTRGFVIFSNKPEKLSRSKETVTIENDCNEDLTEILETLPEEEKNLVQLYYYQELKLRQIADVFQCSESKISRKLKKINAKLKRLLQEF